MNELIVISSGNIGGECNTVNARDLHAFLGAGKDFSTWIKDRIEQFGFTEGQDFVVVEDLSSPKLGSSKARTQKVKDYHLTLDMAKELSMVERNEKGKQARLYFLECERRAKQAPALPQTLPEALRLAADLADKVMAQSKQIEEQKPLVAFAETVAKATNSVLLGDFAKAVYGRDGFIIGRNSLFELLRAWSILDRRNQPYQRYIESGWFTIREGVYENEKTNGPRVCFTTLITGKGQIAIHKKVAEYFEGAPLPQKVVRATGVPANA